MKKHDENKYYMEQLVHEYLKGLDSAIVEASPELDTDIAELGSEIDLIAELNEYQQMNRTGHQLIKSQLKQDMAMKAIEVVDALRAYAKVTNNMVLFAEMGITYWSIYKKRDAEAKDECRFIHDRGVEHLAGITTYGITEAFLLELKGLITDYNANMTKPRMSITERMQLTRGIDDAFGRIDVLLKELDIKVFALRTLYPAVVSHYKDCRRIVDYRGSVLAISGTVKNELDEPIFGATATIEVLDRSTKSTYKGNFEFRNLPDGLYTVVVERPGYEKQAVTVGVVKGETTKINVVLKSTEGQLRVA
ncbi:carboxypeptidase-like regulatory domain-containing protein [Flavobacterium capsici]|uniref:Carboxypeptidase-like regulatory domain-containing protein n=1 Tax=Flavobacterium capsici TaxID=3075618 RepID=A0AA96J6L3_9FLAO|nr:MULTISPECIES: carboxypeptidase-like regulatory domain-containing protein [unclassified Flavobacterium]WNM20281.1 carboxypeptidase-like regulatory domain-containing protein [Flavobacterium sp. PMR2A8]WNM21671.1 carboxypeptidase-like regulatory domain-containing protein [Flavobacterium sp. PMTSA4]